MITAPLLTQGVKVNLPKAAAEPLPAKDAKNPIILSVDAQGQLFLNIAAHPQEALDADAVLAQVTAALQQEPERAVVVKADRSVSYGIVMQAMVIMQRAGASRVGMATDPLPSPQPHAGS
jgi:biopolymer transport protein TolR